MQSHKIFVSCTSQDLGAYRQQLLVDPLLARNGLWVQEGFGALPDSPTSASLALVRECDVFIGIYGFRYGTLVPGKRHSITEAEFDEAVACGLRCLVYFADENLKEDLLAKCDVEQEDALERLEAFKLKASHLVRSHFASQQELASRILNDLNNLSLPLGISRRYVAGSWARGLEDWLADHARSSDIDVTSCLELQWGRFLAAPSWQKICREYLQNMVVQARPLPQAQTLERLVSEVDWGRRCAVVRDHLQRVVLPAAVDCLEGLATDEEDVAVREYRVSSFRRSLAEFRRRVSNPGYDTAFLVAGNAGAGRTHFVCKAIKGAIQELTEQPEGKKGVLFLPVDLGRATAGTLESVLLEQLRSMCGGVRWTDIEEFDRFLTPSSLCVFVIEDLHKWKLLEPRFIDELATLMSRMDRLEHLRWLVTVNVEAFHSVTDHAEHWRAYGFVTPSEIPTIAGWHSLDDANARDNVGIRMILQANPDDDLAREELEATNAHRHLSSPLIANIFIELGIGSPANLVYVDFAANLWADRRDRVKGLAKLDPDPAIRRLQGPGIIDAVVALLSDSWLATGKHLPSRIALGREFGQRASRHADLAFLNEPLFQSVSELFRRSGLLQEHRLSARGDVTCEFHPELIWQYYLAEALLYAGDVSEGPDAALGRWLAGDAPREVKDGAAEFFLLLLARSMSTDSMALLERYCAAGLTGHFPLTAVLHAASKAEKNFRVLVLHGIECAAPISERQALFALLLLARNIDSQIADAPRRMRLLQKHLPAIAEQRFSSYYVYVVDRILDEPMEDDAFRQCMTALEGCEVLDGPAGERRDFTEALAKICIRKIELRDAKSGVELILEWLRDGPDAQRVEQWRKKFQGQTWQRYFIHEWILCHLCRWVAMAPHSSVDAYGFLENMGWYRFGDGIAPIFHFDMEREAAIAIGRRYRYMPEKARLRFVAEMERLAQDPDERKAQHAFFMIRHSSWDGGRIDVIVDEAFGKALRQIWKRGRASARGRLAALVRKQREMFEANLKIRRR